MYSGSDSERKKGKDREERFEDRASIAPGYPAAYGQSPISRGTSGADAYSATWGGVPAMTSTQSPSVRPPNSRSVSFYDSQPASAVEPHPTNQAWGPESGVDEHHQSYNKWDNPSPQRSPHVAQLNVILDRPKSPFDPTQAPVPPEGRPKSAFGDPAPAMFGDNGPAAYTGETAGVSAVGASAIFGEPPASVFGQNAGGETGDSWGFPAAAATTPVTTPGKKGKKKNSAIGTPVSGLASRTSPAAGPKSPFGDGASGGLLGSKAPSPYDKGKPLSPLNPASQMNNDQGTEANKDGDWGFESGHQGGTSSWGAVNLDEPPKQPSRGPSPVPPVYVEPPVPEEPETGPIGSKKKKKKTGATAAAEAEDARRKQEEKEAQEKEQSRLAKEEQEKQERDAEEKNRQESEMAQSTGAHQSLFGNTTNQFSGAISSSLSLNPSDKPWLSVDTGGGDDSWTGQGATSKKKGKGAKDASNKPTSTFGTFGSSSWGFSGGLGSSVEAETGGGAAAEESTQQPGAFGNFGSTWGYGGGMGNGLGADTGGETAPTDSAGLFDFTSSSGPNLGWSLDHNDQPPSHNEPPAFGATEGTPNLQNAPGDAAEGVAAGEGAGGGGAEDDFAGEDLFKKKKKAKGKKDATPEEIPTTPAVEAPVTETPTAEDEFNPVVVSGKKKKKKK